MLRLEKISGRSSAVLVAMLAFVLSAVIVVFAIVFTTRFLFCSRIILYTLITAWLAIKFAAKKILLAVPWIISAVIAVTIFFYALGRQFFGAGDAKIFMTQKLSPQNLPHEKTFSLLIIGLTLELHEKFF